MIRYCCALSLLEHIKDLDALKIIARDSRASNPKQSDSHSASPSVYSASQSNSMNTPLPQGTWIDTRRERERHRGTS